MTTEEKKEIKRAVLDEIKAESNDITEIETVSTLDGLTGLPAMQGKKLVTAPLSLLSKPATDAASKANTAAATANKAADTANKAASNANAAASMISPYADRINLAMNGATARFDGFVEGVIIDPVSITSIAGVYYDIKNKRFCAKKGGHYYNNWSVGNGKNDASMYLDESRTVVRKDKVFMCGASLYVWSDEVGNLVVVDKTTKELGTWLITHENVTTIDALNQELDAFDANTAQGLHRVKCWGIPLLVTFANLNVGDNVLMQTIYGSLTMKSDGSGIASINSIGQHAIFVRYYNNGKWNSWGRYGAIAQDGVEGTSKHYVYSSASDETRCVLSSKMWTYVHTDGNLFLRFKKWGANNDTVAQDYSQVMLTGRVSNDKWGLMNPYLYARLNNHTLTEGLSTLDEVKVNYTRFDDSGNKVLTLTKATTAKAGVMTAADKSKLDSLGNISAEGARAAKALYKATGGTKLFGPNNIFDTNNRTLGGVVNKTLYDSSTPTEYTKGSPFEVFCTQGIKSDVDSKKYMIWFGLRKSATYIERYSCQQVIGQTEAEFYVYGTPVAFRLNNGEVYTPQQGSGGLEIGTSTKYIVSRECVIPSYSDLHDAATSEKDGLMSAADKAQLDVIAASMDSFGNSITEQAKRIYDLEQCKPLATKSRNGFMSSEDKTQLQGAFADFKARQRANDVEGYVGKSNVISVPGAVGTTKIAADIYRNAEERDYTPGASFGVYISAGYDENNPNKQCVWFGLPIEATKFVRYRLDYWLHGTADTLVGKYLCDSNDKYYEVREGAVGEYISEALDDTPCIMTIADKRLLNQIKKKLGL